MRAKASGESQNILEWLLERGEHTVGQAMQDLVGRAGVVDGVSRVIDQAAKTKGRIDKNMQILLHLMNLPSRADYHKLLVKIEHLQGSLVNLSMKLDRLLAAQDQPKRKKTAPRST